MHSLHTNFVLQSFIEYQPRSLHQRHLSFLDADALADCLSRDCRGIPMEMLQFGPFGMSPHWSHFANAFLGISVFNNVVKLLALTIPENGKNDANVKYFLEYISLKAVWQTKAIHQSLKCGVAAGIPHQTIISQGA